MTSSLQLAFVILLIYLNSLGAVSCAGENDDRTFDWFKEDDHIISPQDLRFLQQNRISHLHSSEQNAGRSPHNESPTASTQSKARSNSPKEVLGLAGKREKQQQRNMKDRERRKVLKEFFPADHRKRRDRINEREKQRLARIGSVKGHVIEKKMKKDHAGLSVSSEENENAKAGRRLKRLRYEQNLTEKIKNNQATDKQKEMFKQQFGKKKFMDLLPKQ